MRRAHLAEVYIIRRRGPVREPPPKPAPEVPAPAESGVVLVPVKPARRNLRGEVEQCFRDAGARPWRDDGPVGSARPRWGAT